MPFPAFLFTKNSTVSIRLVSALLLSVLTACSDSSEQKAPKASQKNANGDIYLASTSPKKAYLKTTVLTLSQRPLLEPLAGKITLNENLTSRISSPVAGRAISMPIGLGKQVVIGEQLLLLDSPDVAQAEADFSKASADLTLALHAYTRQKELYEGKAAPRKDYEQAQDSLTQARSELDRALERLENLHVKPNQNDGRFALRSPIAGVILERHVNMGMEIRPDLPDPLYVISDISKLSLLMEIFEVNLAKIKNGQSVLFSVPAYPNETFTATVKYIGQQLDETTRTVLVRCEFDNQDGKLLPGMYATVNVQSPPGDQALVIPLTAVFTEDESDYVFVALDEDHFQRRKVDLGLRLKTVAVVENGLNPGEKLVSEGALMLRTEENIESGE